MTFNKSLMLGSAAALVAIGGAQAADLPVKAKAVEYVKICSLYGAGFYYMPGTDTCIKLGGYVRADTTLNGASAYDQPAWGGAAGQGNRLRSPYATRTRFDFNVDTRTATEYGVVRTYADLVYNWATGDAIGGGTLGVYSVFIQFAGFTIGKALSQFDAPWSGYPGNLTSFLLGGVDDITGVNQFSYTADFGQGVIASISLQDPAAYFQSNLWNTSGATAAGFATGVYGTSSYGGTNVPDIVGMVRVDQAWGLFQASVAAHNIHASYYTPTLETSGHPSDVWGWAGQLALSIKNIPTGPGDTINMSVSYANGASRYVLSGVSPNSFAMYGGTGLPGAYQSIAFAGAADGIFAGTSSALGTAIEKSTAWGFRGSYTHNWDPYWNTSLFGAYTGISYTGAAKSLICAPVLGIITGTCNPDFNIAQIGTVTRWTPVKNLTFSGEVLYTLLDQRSSGAIALPAIATKPAALYDFKDQGTWTVGINVRRNF
jgi:hypothetical protein